MATPIVMLMGPTAAGKTQVALEIAKRLPVEIVSVDSANVYSQMNIGTAKPDSVLRQLVPHHLIDIISPVEAYSAARFRQEAIETIDAIHVRGRIPLLVGGTFFYFNALQKGIHDLPVTQPIVRLQIEQEAKLQGWPAMHRRLQGIDPAMAEKLNRHDGQRIGRALEIYEQSGYPMSEWLAKPVYNSFDYPTIRLVLEPEIRNVLHERIAVRFRNMLTAGLVDELQGLKKCYELHESMPSMRCVGYRQAWKYLDGLIDFKEMEEAGIAATRQLARRQLTWLRSMKDVNRVNCFDENVVEKSYQLVLQALDRIKG